MAKAKFRESLRINQGSPVTAVSTSKAGLAGSDLSTFGKTLGAFAEKVQATQDKDDAFKLSLFKGNTKTFYMNEIDKAKTEAHKAAIGTDGSGLMSDFSGRISHLHKGLQDLEGKEQGVANALLNSISTNAQIELRDASIIYDQIDTGKKMSTFSNGLVNRTRNKPGAQSLLTAKADLLTQVSTDEFRFSSSKAGGVGSVEFVQKMNKQLAAANVLGFIDKGQYKQALDFLKSQDSNDLNQTENDNYRQMIRARRNQAHAQTVTNIKRQNFLDNRDASEADLALTKSYVGRLDTAETFQEREAIHSEMAQSVAGGNYSFKEMKALQSYHNTVDAQIEESFVNKTIGDIFSDNADPVVIKNNVTENIGKKINGSKVNTILSILEDTSGLTRKGAARSKDRRDAAQLTKLVFQTIGNKPEKLADGIAWIAESRKIERGTPGISEYKAKLKAANNIGLLGKALTVGRRNKVKGVADKDQLNLEVLNKTMINLIAEQRIFELNRHTLDPDDAFDQSIRIKRRKRNLERHIKKVGKLKDAGLTVKGEE